MKAKLLCLCDSPTLESGFARVAQNLLSRWNASGKFEQIWVWGIGYNGRPHEVKFLENRISPAQTQSRPHWHDGDNLRNFLLGLNADHLGGTEGGFTHVWIMQDLFLLWPMAEKLLDVARAHGVQTLLYFPVDSPLDAQWTTMLSSVDVPVAYCQYGLQEAVRALNEPLGDRRIDQIRARAADQIRIQPHGVDRATYRSLAEKDPILKEKMRNSLFKGKVVVDDFLMLNVSHHQKRKGLAQSLMVFKKVKELAPELNPKMYFHMGSENQGEGTDLKPMARQLGLKIGEDVFFGDDFFTNGHAQLTEGMLNGVYNMADLLLTTTYGEGWGLPITEAMAAGLVVAGPNHSSVAELLAEDRGICFNTLGHDVITWDNSRVRPRTDVDDAAMKIVNARRAKDHEYGSMDRYRRRASQWIRGDYLNWDRIAAEWLEYFEFESVV